MLTRDFYARDARTVARELIGKRLVVNNRSVVITETEAYLGLADLASHARFGKTKRNSIMWESGGHLYVYLIYGIHEMVNIVTGHVGAPSAVLLRAGIAQDNTLIKGPGKLTAYLGITRHMNGLDLVTDPRVYMEEEASFPTRIISTPRIGVAYAGKWALKKWRYVVSS